MTIPRKARHGIILLVVGTILGLWSHGRGPVGIVGSALVLMGGFRVASHLSSSPAGHWRFVNILMRLFGIMAAFVGLGALATALQYWRNPAATGGIATLTGSAALDAAMMGALSLAIGAFVLRRKAVRPDLGDPPVSDRVMRVVWGLPSNWRRPVPPNRETRSWWTGETIPPRKPK
jgi:hypothetical protein